jgi:hypothetical protein
MPAVPPEGYLVFYLAGIDIHPMTLEINFRLPFMREFLLLHGVVDASKSACLWVLGKGSGQAILLAVGGAQESLLSEPGTYDVVSGNCMQSYIHNFVRCECGDCVAFRIGILQLAEQVMFWLMVIVSCMQYGSSVADVSMVLFGSCTLP